METNEALQLLGLTPNEITIYRYLLRKGISTGTQIYKENALDKSSTYRALYELMDKDLAYSIGEKRNQRFTAKPTEKLVSLHKTKLNKLNSVSDSINTFIKEIDDYAKENYRTNRIQIYEGAEGYKLFMKQRLTGHIEVIRLFGPLEKRVTALEDYHDFVLKEIIQPRIDKKIPVRVLFDRSVKTEALERTNSKIMKETRQIDKDLNLQASVATFGDRSGFYSEQDGTFLGVIIKDPFITNVINAMFDFLWENSKEII